MSILTGTLCVRQENGRYRQAEAAEITAHAAALLEPSLKKTDALTSPHLVKDYLRYQLRLKEHEVFAMLLLDNRHRTIEYVELFRGTIDGASVHPREVVKEVFKSNAAAVIFAHNHPSGNAEPSQADLKITRRLGDALKLIEVRVLDHIVVGDGDAVSFAERGLI